MGDFSIAKLRGSGDGLQRRTVDIIAAPYMRARVSFSFAAAHTSTDSVTFPLLVNLFFVNLLLPFHNLYSLYDYTKR